MRAGFGKLVFIIRKDIEQPFKEVVGSRFEKRIAVEYVFQELDKIPAGFSVPAGRTKPWGTTQAIMMAADAIHEPFATAPPGVYFSALSSRLASACDSRWRSPWTGSRVSLSTVSVSPFSSATGS